MTKGRTEESQIFYALMEAEQELAQVEARLHKAKQEMLVSLISTGDTHLIDIKMDALYRHHRENRKTVLGFARETANDHT